MTTHARDVALAVLLAAAIVAAAVYGYAALRQNAMPIVARNCRLPKRCFPGSRPFPSASCAFRRSYRPVVHLQPRLRPRPGSPRRRGGPHAKAHGERFAKAYDSLPRSKRLAVLRYYEAYDKGRDFGRGRPRDRQPVPPHRAERSPAPVGGPAPEDRLPQALLRHVPDLVAGCRPRAPPSSSRPSTPSCTTSRTGAAQKACTDEHAFTVVVERLENQGMRDHRIVCPDANGVLAQ